MESSAYGYNSDLSILSEIYIMIPQVFLFLLVGVGRRNITEGCDKNYL